MPDQPAGPILDGLGVHLTLEDGGLVAAAMVLAKTVDSDGTVGLVIADSEGMSWLDRLGMVAAAKDIIGSGSYETRGD